MNSGFQDLLCALSDAVSISSSTFEEICVFRIKVQEAHDQRVFGERQVRDEEHRRAVRKELQTVLAKLAASVDQRDVE